MGHLRHFAGFASLMTTRMQPEGSGAANRVTREAEGRDQGGEWFSVDWRGVAVCRRSQRCGDALINLKTTHAEETIRAVDVRLGVPADDAR